MFLIFKENKNTELLADFDTLGIEKHNW